MKKEKFEIKNTIGMFDFFKGFAMITMLIVHTQGLFDAMPQYATVGEFLQNFNPILLVFFALFSFLGDASMPALFVISGYGYRKTTNRKCIVKQINTLVIPYLVAMILTVIVHFFSFWVLFGSGRQSLSRTIHFFVGGLFGMSRSRSYFGFELFQCGPIWFLLSLAIALVVFNILANHFDGVKLILISALVAFVGWVLSVIYTFPWSMSQGFMAVFYLSLGYWIKKNKVFITAGGSLSKKKEAIIVIIAIIIKFATLSTGVVFNMANELYPFGIVSILVNGIIGAFAVKLFLQINRFNGPVSSFIRVLGRQSLYVMCIHSIELLAVGGYLQEIFCNRWQGTIGMRTLIIILVRVSVVFTCTFIYDRIKKTGKLSFMENIIK